MGYVRVDGLLVKQSKEGQKVILPVLHNMTIEEVAGISLTLAGIFSIQSSQGMEKVVKDLLAVLRPEIASTLPEPTVAQEPATFRAQIFAFVTDVREMLRKYGTDLLRRDGRPCN